MWQGRRFGYNHINQPDPSLVCFERQPWTDLLLRPSSTITFNCSPPNKLLSSLHNNLFNSPSSTPDQLPCCTWNDLHCSTCRATCPPCPPAPPWTACSSTPSTSSIRKFLSSYFSTINLTIIQVVRASSQQEWPPKFHTIFKNLITTNLWISQVAREKWEVPNLNLQNVFNWIFKNFQKVSNFFNKHIFVFVVPLYDNWALGLQTLVLPSSYRTSSKPICNLNNKGIDIEGYYSHGVKAYWSIT